jgi:hypothetical protein
MRTCLSLLFLLAFTCGAAVQSGPQASAAGRGFTQQPGTNSETYGDTLGMIKAWRETEESPELGRLFAVGDLRTSDLLAACNNPDEEIASTAFLTLQLLGKPECLPCGDTISQKHDGLPFVCGAGIVDADFTRIERWVAKKQTGNGYECGDEYEPLTPLDDSVVYALILDASPRSRLILKRMLAIEKACVAGDTTVAGVETRLVATSAAHRQICWFRDLCRAAKHDHFFRSPQRMRMAMCRGDQSTLNKTERPASIFARSMALDQAGHMPVQRVPCLGQLLGRQLV